MSGKRDCDQLIRKLLRQGWTREVRGNGHYLLVSPSGERLFTASTPGSRRSLQNLRAELRRKGADL